MGWSKRRKYKGGGFHSSYKRTQRNYDKVYAKFRKLVKQRDKVCQYPSCGARKQLQVHHIIRWVDSPHLRYEPRNGILLCKKCHEYIQNKEEFYIELFSNIVARKYDNPD